jgi:hypothetical protein
VILFARPDARKDKLSGQCPKTGRWNSSTGGKSSKNGGAFDPLILMTRRFRKKNTSMTRKIRQKLPKLRCANIYVVHPVVWCCTAAEPVCFCVLPFNHIKHSK